MTLPRASGGVKPRHVLAVRMYAARVEWLGGAPCWEADTAGPLCYVTPDGRHRVPLTPRTVARAQYCLNRIAVHPVSAGAALGDADAFLARRRAALEVAKRLLALGSAVRCRAGSPNALVALLLLEAVVLCEPPFSPARRLVLLLHRTDGVAPAGLRAMAGDDSLPLCARALAALTLGAISRRAGGAEAHLFPDDARLPPAVRAARQYALRRGLPDEPRLLAALLAAADPGESQPALLSLAERFTAARTLAAGSPFALPPDFVRSRLLPEGGYPAREVVNLLETVAHWVCPLAVRLRSRRHELPKPPQRETPEQAGEARGVRARALAEMGELLVTLLRLTGGEPGVVRDFGRFVGSVLDHLPGLLGPQIGPALLRPLRAAAQEDGTVARTYLAVLAGRPDLFWEGVPPTANPLQTSRKHRDSAGWLSERLESTRYLGHWLDSAWKERFRPALHLARVFVGDVAGAARVLEETRDPFWRGCWQEQDEAAWYTWVLDTARALKEAGVPVEWSVWSLLTHVADQGSEGRSLFRSLLGYAFRGIPRGEERVAFVDALAAELCRHSRADGLNALRRLEAGRDVFLPRTAAAAAGPGKTEHAWQATFRVALAGLPEELVGRVRERIAVDGPGVWRDGNTWAALEHLTGALNLAGALHTDGAGAPEAFLACFDAARAALTAEDGPGAAVPKRIRELLERFPGLRAPVTALMPRQARRCLRLLDAVHQVARPGCPDKALAPLAELWPGEAHAGSARSDDPEWDALLDLVPDVAPLAAGYWYARWLTGDRGDLPPGLRRAALGEAEKRARELAFLEARLACGRGNAGIAARVASLRARLADEERMRARAADEARERLTAVTREAQMAAAERAVEACWRIRLTLFLGKPVAADVAFTEDLRNAVVIASHIEKNRKLLQRLLRAHVAGGAARPFLDEHPGNRAFRERLAAHGADAVAWLGAHPRRVVLAGKGKRRVLLALERDPLRVLQMGNPFGTCLSASECNAYSTVANACEQNKRVLYAVDEATGRIVGRRLIGLTENFELLGFRPYVTLNDEEAEELQEAMRVYLLDFARVCGLRTVDWGTVPTLFAEAWYDDGTVPWEKAAGAEAEPALPHRTIKA